MFVNIFGIEDDVREGLNKQTKKNNETGKTDEKLSFPFVKNVSTR